MEESVTFTERENSIREKWLFWSIQTPVFFYACFLALALYFSAISFDIASLITLVSGTLIGVGGMYLNYYCSYKKPGTILLLLTMIGIGLNLLTTLSNPEEVALISKSKGTALFVILCLVWEAYVFYYSYKLRKINKTIKDRKLTVWRSQLYTHAVSVFSTAKNIEELNEQFAKLKAANDFGKAVQVLAKAYDEQKKKLLLSI